MLFKSALMTLASGSIFGLTASRNRGGQYFRARTVPTDPGTPNQSTIRGFVTDLSNRWVNTLTQAQRDLWTTYADNVPLINPLGDPITVSGLNMYIRSNVPILQGSLPRVDAGPTIFDIGDYTSPSFALDEPNDEVDVSFTDTDDWANEDDAGMLIWTSRPQNQTINYFKGPYQIAGIILGDLAVPPTSPAAIGLAFPVAVGQRIFVRANVVRADGRLSAPFRGQADA